MLWPVLFALMAVVPVWLARAASVELDAAMDPGLPEEEVRQVMQRLAVEKLVRGEMARLNLDVAAYDKALEEKFGASFAEQEKRLLEEWTKTGKTPEEQAPLLAQEKARARERFLGLGSLLKSFSVKRLGAHPDTVGTWQITLEGEVDEALLSLHVQRLQQVGSKAFRHLWINTQVRPENFSWEDLQLTRAADFVTPIEAEWLKWFQQNPSADVESVVLCGEACQKSLAIWQTIDEKSLAGSLPAEFSDSLLMSVTITLHREVLGGTVPESKITYGGGVVLQDSNTKRVLHWADLPAEYQKLPQGEAKQFNSAVASHCYRYPLGKFLEVKNQVGRSVSLTGSMPVRLVNLSHLGQALRFIEWVGAKAAPMQAQGKLDSFNRKETRVLVFFRGEGNKFKSLVSGVKELESEWGPLTVDDSGSEVVITLGGPPKT